MSVQQLMKGEECKDYFVNSWLIFMFYNKDNIIALRTFKIYTFYTLYLITLQLRTELLLFISKFWAKFLYEGV